MGIHMRVCAHAPYYAHTPHHAHGCTQYGDINFHEGRNTGYNKTMLLIVLDAC